MVSDTRELASGQEESRETTVKIPLYSRFVTGSQHVGQPGTVGAVAKEIQERELLPWGFP